VAQRCVGLLPGLQPGFEAFFGHPEADIVGKTDFDFVDAELAQFFRANDQAAIAAGGVSINEEWVTYASDGHRALLSTCKTPMYNRDGKVQGVLGISHDITKQRRTEEALELHQRHLQDLVDERTHELNVLNQTVAQHPVCDGVCGYWCPLGQRRDRPIYHCQSKGSGDDWL
jgi:PAS domain S-box-containing protein